MTHFQTNSQFCSFTDSISSFIFINFFLVLPFIQFVVLFLILSKWLTVLSYAYEFSPEHCFGTYYIQSFCITIPKYSDILFFTQELIKKARGYFLISGIIKLCLFFKLITDLYIIKVTFINILTGTHKKKIQTLHLEYRVLSIPF